MSNDTGNNAPTIEEAARSIIVHAEAALRLLIHKFNLDGPELAELLLGMIATHAAYQPSPVGALENVVSCMNGLIAAHNDGTAPLKHPVTGADSVEETKPKN